MPQNDTNHKRIARNTLALYFRMFLIMAISLYTSRVILKTLGANDFGIFSLVGGVVTMLAYLNTVFIGSTQRFISYSLGEGDFEKIKDVFQNTITVHVIIAIIIFLIAETIGVWFVNEKLNIDPSRMIAANWTYQCAVFSLLLTILCVPYKSCIIAHEHISFYAYLSVVEALARLAIVFVLIIVDLDKLVLYSLLHLFVSIIIPLWSIGYCHRFEECRFGLGKNMTMLKEISVYTGWGLIGNLGFSMKDQLSNVIMNLFLGTTINAARGIAAQVNGVVFSFSKNFTTALAPQITQQYAKGNLQESQKLVYAGARYSFFLMSIIAIPIIVNIGYILKFWLGDVPPYTEEFVVITLIASVFYSATNTQTTAIQATGDIKWFQIGLAIILLAEIPIAYLLLKFEYPPYYAMLPAIFTNIISFFFRILILRKKNHSYSIKIFIFDVFFRCTLLMFISTLLTLFVNHLLSENFSSFILSFVLSILMSLSLIFCFGTKRVERLYIKKIVSGLLKRI